MSHQPFTPLLVVVVVCMLAATATATEIIHFTQDFTDNSLADEVGSMTNIDAALGLRTQSGWRDSSKSYFGFSTADTFEGGDGFANAKSFLITVANGGLQQAGRVFVYDTSYISDMATTTEADIYYSSGPLISTEYNWTLEFGPPQFGDRGQQGNGRPYDVGQCLLKWC
jgi:hypothetical protein